MYITCERNPETEKRGNESAHGVLEQRSDIS